MPRIEQYIGELLVEHDCVIVPEFGGFVGNEMPASIKKSGGTIQPPYKQISFNQSLKRNDGLLINHLAESEKEDYSSAEAKVSSFAKQATEKLKSEKELLVENIGTLYYDSNNKLRFQQDYSINYLKSAFGLAPIQPIKKGNTIKQTNAVQSRTTKLDKPKAKPESKKVKRTILYAAAALPVLAYLVWLPLKTDILQPNGNFHYSDLNPFSEKICAEYNQRLTSLAIPSKLGDEQEAINFAQGDFAQVYFTEDRAGHSPVIVRLKEVPAVAESTHVETVKPKTKLRFHIIGGCFSILKNAKRFVNNLGSKGFQSHIVDNHKGLNRVSVQSFATREEAVKKLNEIRQNVNDKAWLLVK